MGRMIRLGATDWPRGRPFTNPDLVNGDYEILIGMIHELHSSRFATPQMARPEPGRDRVIVTSTGRTHGDKPVTVVGFFGQRRRDGSPEIAQQIEAVNARMLADFEAFPLLLGYVSRLLADNFNYANLVVLAGEEGIEKWRDRADHVPAAVDLSPQYYSCVRIYNGSMSGGIGGWDGLRLNTVKYWDYRQDPVWHATRIVGPAAP